MKPILHIKKLKLSIWGLALWYFLFYVPYSGLIKALSGGLVPGADAIGGFEMLPAVVAGIWVCMLSVLTIMGWWKYAGRLSLPGFSIPFASNRYTLFSGIGTAFIILTTTLSYSFEGISIVFAALLMRGGTLIISPVIDSVFRRKVHWNSWVAFGLSLVSLMAILIEQEAFSLTWLAMLNVFLYLLSYVFRLQFMTKIAKSDDRSANYRYFVEEMLVAMVAILILPLLFPFIGYGNGIQDLIRGWAVFSQPANLLPALLIGICYGGLYIFGTRIFLDQRENTFCIPINRSASLLAGVVAALILGAIHGLQFVSSLQLISACILLLAILFLAAPGIGKLAASFRKEKASHQA